ncbi:MAG TPA: ATP-binding protein [Polyangiaceae bacterium]|nr:ATP-binding protein [Polyangiaceae bacterium]
MDTALSAWLGERAIACEVNGSRIVAATSAFARCFELAEPDCIGREFSSLFSDTDARVSGLKLDDARAQRREVSFLSKHWRASGARIWLRWHLDARASGNVRALAFDVTHERVLDDECAQLRHMLEHSQRLAAIGALANRIVHDLNHLMLAMQQGVELSLATIAQGHPSHEDLTAVQACLATAVGLTSEIRRHGGAARAELELIDLAELIRAMQPVLALATRPDTRLVVECIPGTVPIYGHAVQIRQVLLNLVVNASEAIGARPGRIVVRVEPTLDASGTQGVCVSVVDDGCGMSPETKARLFEPFFSTKSSSRGLGLSGTLAILEAHHAQVSVQSELGRGTKVEVRFP